MEYANTWVNIDLDAIAENFRAIQEKAGKPVCAVVKADAYGHGAVAVAQLLEGQCAFFGVSSVAEAVELKNAGIQTPVLLLGHTPCALFAAVVEHELRCAIFDMNEAKALSDEAVRQGKTAYIHFAVDTGMSRIGFQVNQQAADQCAAISKLPGICVEGLFSHLATADERDLAATKAQAALFDRFDAMLRARGLQITLRHLDNSAGIMNFGCQYDMVRAGIVLYGLYPSENVDKDLLPLKPAMQWETAVSYVKLLEAGRAVSYGGTYVTRKPTMVATIPAGYADGYRRSLSGSFYVLIRGKRAPILGRVCMDQFMVDVTDIPGVCVGDRVVLMGTDGDETISAEAIAAAAHSFNYEQVCDISHRVSRVYFRDGKQVGKTNYLLDRESTVNFLK